jgi:EmrB/QacA subfamily drug resistance transporter
MSQSVASARPTGGISGGGAGAGAGDRNPWLVLLVLCTAVFMLLLDTTIVNVAQRKIQESLDADLTQIQWVLDSYILAFAVLLLSFGRLGDVFGRKKLFMVGITIFTLASALCGASVWLGDLLGVSSISVLIGARVIQGIGGAFMMPQSLSLLTVAFPADKRGAAMGAWGAVVALGAVTGPIIGGLIVTDFAWEWVFLINLPVGAVALWATRAIVPESVDPQATKRIDWGGLILSGVGIFALVYASIEGNKEGWTSPLILGLYAASVVLLAAFIWWENRVADPMMKLELFKLRNFSIGAVISLVVSFGMLGIFFPMTLFLQGVLGFSPIKAGLTMTPMSLMIMVAAPLAGRLTDRIGARWIMVTGLSLVSVGILFIVDRVDLQTDWLHLLPALIVAGAGMGLTFAPMTAAAMADVPPRIAGSASGIINTMRNVGQVLGIAVLGSVLATRIGTHTADRLAETSLDPATQAQVTTLAKESRFELIPGILPADQIGLVMRDVQLGFIDALHNTFFVGAFACAVAGVMAYFIRNPLPRKVAKPAAEPTGESEANTAPAVVAAD